MDPEQEESVSRSLAKPHGSWESGNRLFITFWACAPWERWSYSLVVWGLM